MNIAQLHTLYCQDWHGMNCRIYGAKIPHPLLYSVQCSAFWVGEWWVQGLVAYVDPLWWLDDDFFVLAISNEN